MNVTPMQLQGQGFVFFTYKLLLGGRKILVAIVRDTQAALELHAGHWATALHSAPLGSRHK